MLLVHKNTSWFLFDSNRYLVLTKIRGPAAIKRTIDLKAVHWFALKRELNSPNTTRENSHIISLGVCLTFCQVGSPEKIRSDGAMQANRIENLLTKGDQLWMATIEKNRIKIVEKQKVIRAQLWGRDTIFREVGGLSFEGVKKFKRDKAIWWLIWLNYSIFHSILY